MDIDLLRKICLAFPGVTEQIQWGDDLLFKVGGKMFAITPLIPAPVCLSFKATSENFVELIERPGIIPAPYLARAKWVALESRDALTAAELTSLLRGSYDLVVAKLPRRMQESLTASKRRPAKPRKPPHKARSQKSKHRGKR